MAEEEDQGPKYVLVTEEGETRKLGSLHFTGRATASFPNGDLYEGDFEDGKRHGRGCYRYAATGDKYDGAFVQNIRHGLGTMTYNGKGEYQGYWENGHRHGEGVFNYPSGDSYTGWWRFGKKEGCGTYYSAASKMKLTGDWKNNQIVNGTWEMPNGNSYRGTFNENKPLGEGSWSFNNGNKQCGQYAQVRGEPKQDDDGNEVPGDLHLQWVADNDIVSSAMHVQKNCSAK